MKRRVLMLALLLLMGAIVNVAVAWGCASFVPVRLSKSSRAFTDYEVQWRSLPWAARFPEELTKSAFAYDGLAIGRHVRIGMLYFTTVHRLPEEFAGEITLQNDIVQMGRIDTGWPLMAMRGHIWLVSRTEHADRRDLLGQVILDGLAEGIRQPDDDFDYSFSRMNLVPVKPLWPGFAINTVFYAAVLWLIFAAPFALRRRRRIKRGLCPKCAYPVGTNDVCTECGAAVPG